MPVGQERLSRGWRVSSACSHCCSRTRSVRRDVFRREPAVEGNRRPCCAGRSAGRCDPPDLRRLVLLIGVGIALSVAGSVWASRFVSTLLFGLEPGDPVTLIGSILVLASMGALAGWSLRAGAIFGDLITPEETGRPAHPIRWQSDPSATRNTSTDWGGRRFGRARRSQLASHSGSAAKTCCLRQEISLRTADSVIYQQQSSSVHCWIPLSYLPPET